MAVVWPAFLLAGIAGFIDALGYLELSQVFTAHMSGNSAAVGAHLGEGDWHNAMVHGLAIPAFIFGAAIGVMVERAANRKRARGRLAPAYALEMLLLIAFMTLSEVHPRPPLAPGSPKFFVLVWLLAVAMGLQSATLRRAGGMRVRTTFVSGMLTNMTEEGTLYLVELWERWRGGPSEKGRESLGRRAAEFGLIFGCFLVGGIGGGFGEARWGSWALVVPLAGLVVAVANDWVSRSGGGAER